MRARERGSEGVGLGYGDIGFIDVYNKVVQETCKINWERGERTRKRQRGRETESEIDRWERESERERVGRGGVRGMSLLVEAMARAEWFVGNNGFIMRTFQRVQLCRAACRAAAARNIMAWEQVFYWLGVWHAPNGWYLWDHTFYWCRCKHEPLLIMILQPLRWFVQISRLTYNVAARRGATNRCHNTYAIWNVIVLWARGV